VDYYQGLSEAERGEEDLMVLGRARITLAEVLGGRSQDNLGQYDEAIEELQGAIVLWEQLVEQSPDDLSRAQFLVLARSRLADVYQGQDRHLEAMHVLEPAATQLEEKLRDTPGNIGTIRILCNVYISIGDVRVVLEDPVMARAAYDRVDELLQSAIELTPEHVGLKEQRGANMRRIGALLESSDPAEAVRMQKESLEIYQSLAQQAPDSANAVQNLAWAWFFLGQTEARVPIRDDALDHLGQGWKLIVLHCSKNPDDTKAREHVTIYLGGMRAHFVFLEAEERIADHCRSAVLVLQPVVESNPDNVALAEMFNQLLGAMRGAPGETVTP